MKCCTAMAGTVVAFVLISWFVAYRTFCEHQENQTILFGAHC